MTPWRLIIESMFSVIDKERVVKPFILLPAQAELDATLTGRDLVPKARQLGISTYVIARYLAKCLTLENRRCVIISHEEDATKRLLATAQFMLENLRSPTKGIRIEASTTKQTQANIIFKETNSWFYIGTAGSRAFGRGDTVSDLHCSEYAWWPDESLFDGIIGSVPTTGEIIIESTGNGIANDFAVRVMRAARGQSHWRMHFFPWFDADEYKLPLAAAERRAIQEDIDGQRVLGEERGVPPSDEVRLTDEHGLKPTQLAWRRYMIEEFGGDEAIFKQEFPSTLTECFQAQGGAIFQDIYKKETKDWVTKSFPGGGTGALEGHPHEDYTYVIGIDSAAGVKLSDNDPFDNSVIQVGCVETGEQVCRWHSGRTSPDKLGEITADLGLRFNTALLVFESNNHGLTAISAARNAGYPLHKIFKRRSPDPKHPERGIVDLGYATTSKTKPLAVGRLRQMLKEGFVIYDELTHHELLSFVESESGALAAQAGAHDDFVMSLVMMAAGWSKAGLEADGKVEAQEAQHKIDKIKSSGKSFISTEDIFSTRHRKGAPVPFVSRNTVKRAGFLGGKVI